MRADRVWLLNHDKPQEDKGKPFIPQVEKKLKDYNIECKKYIFRIGS
jgi:hypothetical protein